MKTVRIMLLTFFLSSVIIFPAILGIYDNIWNSQYLKNIKPDFGINHLRGTELIHHMAIQYYLRFGFLCGIAYLFLSGLSAILKKKKVKSSNVLDLTLENNINDNAEPIIFKAGNVVILSIFGAAALIILFLIVLLYIEFSR